MPGVQLVLASRNAHKLRELGALLAPHVLVALPAHISLPPETGSTFAANALAKARVAARLTGEPALGEDSGIEVLALGGAPGVRSARYAGEAATDQDNLMKLVRETADAEERGAAYVSALAFVEPEGEERVFEARCEGRLADAPRGSGGFGYDPIFLPDERRRRARAKDDRERTMAELTPVHKNAISHRGKSSRLLLEWLRSRP
jgi:XTP/dITP diphosphohydrolase